MTAPVRHDARMDRALLLTGPLGSGKTSVAVEVGRLLDEAGAPNAVVDLDWLCWVGPDLHGDRLLGVLADNLAAVTTRFRAEGVESFVLARAVVSAHEVDALRAALGGAALTVVRLDAPSEVTTTRLAVRGDDQDLAEHARLAAVVAALPVDLVVGTHGRPVRDAAREVLSRAGWGVGAGG